MSKRSNLNDNCKPCIFLGYGHEEFCYRLYDPLEKAIGNTNVVFPEKPNGMPNFTPNFSVTKHPTLALDNQGRRGYVEDYDDTTDDGQDHDHLIDNISASPPEVEKVSLT